MRRRQQIGVAHETALQEQLAPFHEAMKQKHERPDGDDVRIRAFAEGVGALIKEDRHIAQSIVEYTGIRHRLSPNVQVNLLLRALSKQFLKDPEGYGGYPEKYDDPRMWYKGANRVMYENKNSISTDNFYFDLWARNIQSNKSERYKVLPLLNEIYADRFADRKVSILDVGASQNQGLKQLRQSQKFPFSRVRTYTDTEYKTDPQKKVICEIVNNAISKGINLGMTVGSDIVPPNDPEVIEWTKSCSFYPSELMDKEKTSRYDALSRDVEDVDFVCADATEPDRLRSVIDKDKFTITFICTMLYMLDNNQRKEVIKAGDNCTEEDGLVVVQDFARPDPEDPSKLMFYDTWTPWRYNTMILDKTKPDLGFQEIINWKNGRCDELMIKLGSKATELFFR